MRPLRAWWAQFQEYDRLVGISHIARRYFAMNAFDGVLTIIGVLMGNFTARVESARIVVSTGLATCVAMGVSGLWGAYLTEAAERQRGLVELSRHTLSDLNHTKVGRASRAAVIVVALVDGFSPFLAALIVLVPFFFSGLFPSIRWVYFTALGTALAALFALGMFLGRTSQANVLFYGVKTIVAGIISILISILLGA